LYERVKDRINKPRTYRNVARKAFLQVSRNRKPSRKVIRKGIKKQLQYLRRNITYITELSTESPLTGLSRKLYRNLLVLQEVYRQQSEMFEEKKHSVTGRIVSISQPHVRPIVRGKAKAPVEFGAKISVSRVDGYAYLETISWEPYHEGILLKEHINVYKKRFGCYPESVLADKIYRTRENLRFCKELGIRLAGPPLGRPPKDKAVYKAILQEAREDEKQRVPIEGVFGRAKRKYGMGLIKEKLQNTSENTLAMIILGMNLEKILGDLFVLLNQFIGKVIFQPIFRWKLAEKN
jgi:transposase, IS5 family